MTDDAADPDTPWVLQLCHGYTGPFLDCARQYAVLFRDTPCKVCTVYLTGAPSDEVVHRSASDQVVFLNYRSHQIRGLKLGAIRDVRRLVGTRRFVLCVAHRAKPIYVALLASRLPVIGVHHAFGGYQRWTRRFFVNRLKRRLALLGVSDAVRDDMREQLPDWQQARIATLYNRVDVQAIQAEQLPREAARAQLGLPQDAFIVGNVGRLHPDKDQVLLIRGFARARSALPAGAMLAIMGSGRLEASLKALAAQELPNGAVRFLGQVPHGRRYFQAFDQFVLTSQEEPFGMVLLEAMAAGVPVLCRDDCGGGPEVAADEVLFAADADSLAQAMVDDAQARRFPWRTVALEKFTDTKANIRFQLLLQQFGLSALVSS